MNYFKKTHRIWIGGSNHGKVDVLESDFGKDLKTLRDKVLTHLPILLTTGKKEYRLDLNLYEQPFTVLRLFTFYVYSRWNQVQPKRKVSLFIKKPESKRYFIFTELPPITVNKHEVKSIYNGNKWIVPINYKLTEL